MNNTLSNGLDLLLILASSAKPYQLSEIANQINLPKSHVHRLLQTLIEHQYVEQASQRRYQIGIGALRLGHALLSQIPIRQYALPIMQKAVQSIKRPLTLALPFGHEGITVVYVTHDGIVRDTLDSLGSVLNSYSSACGKLFFAFMKRSPREELLKDMIFEKRGPNTHMTISSLKKDLNEIKRKEISISFLENGQDVVAMALPVKNDEGIVVAALGLSDCEKDFPKSKYKSVINQLQKNVKIIEKFYAKEPSYVTSN
ncbi:MAG: hypothetical protein COA79_12135 [Planctomycetota bacterium]|nr:MAG: hypothetical protein COA79_12135 [Planctomycetota bacterium]